MSLTEAYYFLLFDSVLAELILPLQTQLVYPAMVIFGGYNIPVIFMIAIFGSMVGAVGNWYIGRLANTAMNKYAAPKPEKEQLLGKISHFIYKWRILFALGCGFFPVIGGLLSLIFGFFSIRVIYFLAFFTIAKAAYLALALL